MKQDSSSTSNLDNFKEAMRKLLTVSKPDLDAIRKEEAQQKRSAKTKHPRPS